MASSIIHLAITNELIKLLSFTDANRLKFGAVVVDAGVGGNMYGNAHMKVNVQDGTKNLNSTFVLFRPYGTDNVNRLQVIQWVICSFFFWENIVPDYNTTIR